LRNRIAAEDYGFTMLLKPNPVEQLFFPPRYKHRFFKSRIHPSVGTTALEKPADHSGLNQGQHLRRE
jgi:hypothetical protein